MKFRLVEANNSKDIKLLVPVLVETDPLDSSDYIESKDYEDDMKKCINTLSGNITKGIT